MDILYVQKNLTNAVVFLFASFSDWVCDFQIWFVYFWFSFETNIRDLFFTFYFFSSLWCGMSRNISYHRSTTARNAQHWTWQMNGKKQFTAEVIFMQFCQNKTRTSIHKQIVCRLTFHLWLCVQRCRKVSIFANIQFCFVFVENHIKNVLVKFVKLSLWFWFKLSNKSNKRKKNKKNDYPKFQI